MLRSNVVETAAFAHAEAETRALAATKAIHARGAEMAPEELAAHAKQANRAVVAMRRAAAEMTLQASTREAVLREALHSELLDCEAVWAHVYERLRAASAAEGEASIDAARRAVAFMDQSIAELCAHPSVSLAGTQQTAALSHRL